MVLVTSNSRYFALLCLMLPTAVRPKKDAPWMVIEGEYTYTLFPGEVDFEIYKEACGSNMLWIKSLDEVVKLSKYPKLQKKFWLGISRGDYKWPNGEPLPRWIHPLKDDNCISMDFKKQTYAEIDCKATSGILCKMGTPPTLQPTPSNDKCRPSSSSFGRIAVDKRFTPPSMLTGSKEPSVITCAARCRSDSKCCGFEFNTRSFICRFVTNPDDKTWITEEETETFLLD